MRIFFFLLFVTVFSSSGAFGQAHTFTANTRIPPIPKAPKAIVVLLPYGNKRLQNLSEQGRDADRAQMVTDLAEVRNRMVSDFRDNYKYGVYYFLPDSIDVRSENTDWKVQLRDANGALTSDLAIDVADTNFMFTFYNYRERQKVRYNTLKEGKGITYEDGGLTAIYKAWILTDRSLNPYPEKLDRRRRYRFPFFSGPNPRRVYYYESPLFDINYRATALKLWSNLYEFLGPAPVN